MWSTRSGIVKLGGLGSITPASKCPTTQVRLNPVFDDLVRLNAVQPARPGPPGAFKRP
jgi:hypothetical protein